MTSSQRRLVKALYAYTARSETDISFEKDDRMEVLCDTEKDWWRVLHRKKRREGYVPANYVADESSVECELWYFPNTSRREAENLLMVPQNPPGTFLVRSTEPNCHEFKLSVKDWSESKGYHTKHYIIRTNDNGEHYISPRQAFFSLPLLILAHSKNKFSLCRVLLQACPRPEPEIWELGPATRDNWEIPRHEIRVIDQIGKGNFGEVYYGMWKKNTEVAIKTLRKGTMSKQEFLREAAIMKNLRHKCLVALYAVCSQEEPIYIIQEYMCKGSLLDYLRNGDGRYLIFNDLVFIAFQVASGMEYLERKKFIHRDLAARNVLIGKNNTAKICDFGLARLMAHNEYTINKRSRLPVKWTAPEALMYGVFTMKSDVWSYGILLMELFTKGKNPYMDMTSQEVVAKVQNGYRMPKPPEIPNELYVFILKCWDAAPENRPTFDFIYHYFEAYTISNENTYGKPDNEPRRKCSLLCCC